MATPAKTWSWRQLGPRDAVFFSAGLAMLVNEFWLQPDPRAWGVFAWIFLWGLVPAFQLDGGAVTPRDVILHMLGMKPPASSPPDPPPPQDPDPEPNGGG